jgi:hypothetical protein
MKTLVTKLYLFAGMVVTVGLVILVWNVTFGHLVQEYKIQRQAEAIASATASQTPGAKQVSFKKSILDENKKIKHYLGYRVLEQQHLEGHFHHIDLEFKSDSYSYCVSCHGDLPHDKVKGIRAFGNMHAAFLSCQTCHAQIEENEKTGVYKWYDRQTGDIVESPVAEGFPAVNYNAKIIPFVRVNGVVARIDGQDKIDFASEYQAAEATLSDVQKAKAKKIIHAGIGKKPHVCGDCHQKESPLLPFSELGYPPMRYLAVISTEVVGMINNYTKFYMPSILNPGVGSESGEMN